MSTICAQHDEPASARPFADDLRLLYLHKNATRPLPCMTSANRVTWSRGERLRHARSAVDAVWQFVDFDRALSRRGIQFCRPARDRIPTSRSRLYIVVSNRVETRWDGRPQLSRTCHVLFWHCRRTRARGRATAQQNDCFRSGADAWMRQLHCSYTAYCRRSAADLRHCHIPEAGARSA